MDIRDIIKTITADLPQRRAGGRPELAPGDRLTGRVIRLESDGRILIDLAGRRALAQTGIAVQPGQLLHLNVTDSGPPLVLRLDSEPSQTAAPLCGGPEAPGGLPIAQRQHLFDLLERLTDSAAAQRAGMSLPREVRNSLTTLKEFLAPLVLDRDGHQVAAVLRRIAEDSGVLYERKLLDLLGGVHANKPPARPEGPADAFAEASPPAPNREVALSREVWRDLKPNLLFLNTLLKPDDPVSAAGLGALPPEEAQALRQGIAQLLTHLEQQQERMALRGGESDYTQVVVHWLPAEDSNRPIGMRIHYPRRGSKGSPGGQVCRVTLLLQMDRLGPLQVDLAMQGRGLHIDFHVRSAPLRDVLEERLDEIRRSLGAHFEALTVAVHISEQKIGRFQDAEGLYASEATRIDMKV